MISGISLKTSDKERKTCWRHYMGYSLWLAEMYFNIHHSTYSIVHTTTFFILAGMINSSIWSNKCNRANVVHIYIDKLIHIQINSCIYR